MADAPGSAGAGVFCVPHAHEQCVYYIAIVGGGEDEPPMALTATADIPKAVSLVRREKRYTVV